MKYNKPPLTIDDQIKLLQGRGLIIDDIEKAKRYLRNISYYHLSAYFKFYQDNDDNFEEKTSFDDVLNIYVFDQKLRLLILDVLERIEKSFKCHLAYDLAMENDDSHWVLNEDLFESQGAYNTFVRPSLKNIAQSKEVCVIHYNKKYDQPSLPPIWIIIEILTFGNCVAIFRNLKLNWRKIIARDYFLGEKFFVNWIIGLARIRNICAHHSRLWNANINFRLKQRHKEYNIFFENEHAHKTAYTPLFDYLVVMQIINCNFNPHSKWTDRLETIINEHNINIKYMGFPSDWKNRFEDIKDIVVKNNLN